jgi:hypothetical protein
MQGVAEGARQAALQLQPLPPRFREWLPADVQPAAPAAYDTEQESPQNAQNTRADDSFRGASPVRSQNDHQGRPGGSTAGAEKHRNASCGGDSSSGQNDKGACDSDDTSSQLEAAWVPQGSLQFFGITFRCCPAVVCTLMPHVECVVLNHWIVASIVSF